MLEFFFKKKIVGKNGHEHGLKITKRIQLEIVEELLDSSRLTFDFYLMLILSAIVVTLGLMLNNSAVIIGGMLITPLLTPILTLALGIVIADGKLIWRSIKIIFISSLIIVGVSLIISFMFPVTEYNLEIESRLISNIPYFLVAFTAGLAATFAWAKKNLYAMLPGVAISVSLLPPLSVVGIGLSNLHLAVARESLVTFSLNLFGIILGSVIIFSLLNFYKAKKETQKEVLKEEKTGQNYLS